LTAETQIGRAEPVGRRAGGASLMQPVLRLAEVGDGIGEPRERADEVQHRQGVPGHHAHDRPQAGHGPQPSDYRDRSRRDTAASLERGPVEVISSVGQGSALASLPDLGRREEQVRGGAGDRRRSGAI
jgi:hypothetical protein